MNAVETIYRELRELGFAAQMVTSEDFIHGPAVIFDYDVKNGRYTGRTYTIGIGFQEEGYPEYPPHFLHIADIEATHLTRHSRHDYQGRSWWVFSFPPSDFWDRLPLEEKNMKVYMLRHVSRIWDQL